MIYGYIRVSSDKQTVENQRYEIHRFCHTHSLHIDGWIEETISGTAAYTRRALGRLLGRVGPATPSFAASSRAWGATSL